MSTCTATWPGGACTLAPAHLGLCGGHYQQRRRAKPFTALRGPRGKDLRELHSVTVTLPAEDLSTLAGEAQTRGVATTEVMREGLSEHARKIRERPTPGRDLTGC
jgi:hypothetical protein